MSEWHAYKLHCSECGRVIEDSEDEYFEDDDLRVYCADCVEEKLDEERERLKSEWRRVNYSYWR